MEISKMTKILAPKIDGVTYTSLFRTLGDFHVYSAQTKIAICTNSYNTPSYLNPKQILARCKPSWLVVVKIFGYGLCSFKVVSLAVAMAVAMLHCNRCCIQYSALSTQHSVTNQCRVATSVFVVIARRAVGLILIWVHQSLIVRS